MFDNVHEAFVQAIQARVDELNARPDPMDTKYDAVRALRRVRRQLPKPRKKRGKVSSRRKRGIDEGSVVFKEAVAQAKAEIIQEKQANFEVMIRRAELRRAQCRFQRPVQFRGIDAVHGEKSESTSRKEEEDDSRPAKRARIYQG